MTALREAVARAMADANGYVWEGLPDQWSTGVHAHREEFRDMADAAIAAIFLAIREPLAEGREHLTVTGKFQSDKYPWCAAGFVPLKTSDPMATDLLRQYALRRRTIDEAFTRDLLEALAAAERGGG